MFPFYIVSLSTSFILTFLLNITPCVHYLVNYLIDCKKSTIILPFLQFKGTHKICDCTIDINRWNMFFIHMTWFWVKSEYDKTVPYSLTRVSVWNNKLPKTNNLICWKIRSTEKGLDKELENSNWTLLLCPLIAEVWLKWIHKCGCLRCSLTIRRPNRTH